MKDKLGPFLQTIIVSVITLIIGVFIGLYSDTFKTKTKFGLQHIDLKTSSADGFLKLPSIAPNDLNITWKQQAVKSISSLSFQIYNFSLKNFENVPFVLILEHPKPYFGLDLDLIASKITGEYDREDLISAVETTRLDDQKIKITFNALLLNQATLKTPNIRANFLVKGPESPKFKIYIDKKGLKFQKFSRNHASDGDSAFLSLLIFLGIVIGLFGGGIIFQARRERKIWRAITQETLTKYGSSPLFGPEEGTAQNQQKLKSFLHEIRLKLHGKRPWPDRVAAIKPKFEDLD